MNFADKLIISIYYNQQKSMLYSDGKAKLFIAKLVFCLLLWIWLLPILGILENNFELIEISFPMTQSRWTYLPLLLTMYIIINFSTIQINQVEEFASREENVGKIKKFRKIFLILIALGFIFLVIVARYNQGNSLLD